MFKTVWVLFKHFKYIFEVAKIMARGGMFPFRNAPDEVVALIVEEGDRSGSDDKLFQIYQEAVAEKNARIRRGEWNL